MVIDKTTGKGCAWRIASRTITKRLIAEGIIGKPFARQQTKSQTKSRYRLLSAEEYSDGQVHVLWRRGSGLADETLWTPSFIEAGIWERAASRFHFRDPLDINVENYLLPELGEYLQSLSDTELVSMTKDYLIDQGVINIPIVRRGRNTYYFNENEVYSLDTKPERFPYESRGRFSFFNAAYETCFNMNLWRKAASQFEVGMTLDECIRIFLKTEMIRGTPKNQDESTLQEAENVKTI